MAGINEERDRQIVPRWRNFGMTIVHGELAPLASRSVSPFTDEMLSNILSDWKEAPTISVAADLVSVALTLGRLSVARDAAEFLLKAAAPTPAQDCAHKYLAISTTKPPPDSLATSSLNVKDVRLEIRVTRDQLRGYLRNPILWTNLARLYTSLGQHAHAEKAIRAALSLAPQNRFVIRASSRFLLHIGQTEQAHFLLSRAQALTSDPWILAAEIATASATRKTSIHVRAAKKMAESGRFQQLHTSELFSALGTLEAGAGNLKIARKLLRTSLERPTENAFAQAAWLAKHAIGVQVIENEAIPSAEGIAWNAMIQGDYRKALEATRAWQNDQSFSSRPAILGSFIAATVLGDFEESIQFSHTGLLCNKDDFSLQNNLAFGLGQLGKVQQANDIISQIDTAKLTKSDMLVLEATKGLVAFRQGLAEVGRKHYFQAITAARIFQDPREGFARVFHAFEEVRIGSATALSIKADALAFANRSGDPELKALAKRLETYVPEET